MDYESWIHSKIHFFEGCRILELGCGAGDFWKNSAELTDSFSELILSDISAGMVDAAKGKYAHKKNINCQVVDILDIPYPENSFDIIIANSMLYHVPELEYALKEVHRALSPNGIFYATTFSTSEGLLNYINNALYEIGLSANESVNDISFSLENGKEMLTKYFSSVNRKLYDDHLEVTKTSDIVEYILSMSSLYYQVDNSNSADMLAYFEKQKDSAGIIKIPKLYGIFIASK